MNIYFNQIKRFYKDINLTILNIKDSLISTISILNHKELKIYAYYWDYFLLKYFYIFLEFDHFTK